MPYSTTAAEVAIIMGSDSDWPTLKPAADALDRFGIGYEVEVVSAHRTPDKMISFGKAAAARGIRVIIAGAGGAAHLPGMVAAVTTLPVIGVPVQLARLDGLDSLLSIVQMPSGVPVATMAINGGANAGLYAVRILASGNVALTEELVSYSRELQELVDQKNQGLVARL
jgi:5-(carboxyamino)imidazole ribonucleotide mutase